MSTVEYLKPRIQRAIEGSESEISPSKEWL
jgi:hypothetical protein